MKLIPITIIIILLSTPAIAKDCWCKYYDGCNVQEFACNESGQSKGGYGLSTLMYCEDFDPKWELIDIECEDKKDINWDGGLDER